MITLSRFVDGERPCHPRVCVIDVGSEGVVRPAVVFNGAVARLSQTLLGSLPPHPSLTTLGWCAAASDAMLRRAASRHRRCRHIM
jgi:hypothetical protein